MTTTTREYLAAIKKNPLDMSLRLVYADYLEAEHNEQLLARVIREHIRLCELAMEYKNVSRKIVDSPMSFVAPQLVAELVSAKFIQPIRYPYQIVAKDEQGNTFFFEYGLIAHLLCSPDYWDNNQHGLLRWHGTNVGLLLSFKCPYRLIDSRFASGIETV